MTDESPPLRVFVDNTDRGIQYHGEWELDSGLPTELSSLDYPDYQGATWYGTMSISGKSPSLSYTFNGTAFTALFSTPSIGLIISCSIDHHQHIVEAPFLGHMICKNSTPLSPGTHNLTIVVEEFVFFDGLFYTPTVTSMPDSGVDVMYEYEGGEIGGGIQGRLWVNSTRNDTNLANAGDRLDVEFNGISLGIYAMIDFHTSEPTLFQYILDNDQAINFTITSPAFNHSSPVATVDRQLILQTPSQDKGLHQLQLSIIETAGSGPEATWFTIENIVVQNSSNSAGLKLSQVPSASLNASTINTPSSLSMSSQTSRDSIIAIVIPIFVVLLLSVVIWFLRRAIQRRTRSSQANERRVISPFVVSIHPGRILGWLPQHAWREKGLSDHGELGLLPRTLKFNREVPRAQNAPRRVRYITHQDGGQIDEPSNHVEGEEEVVNLPPDYSTIRRLPSISINPGPIVGASGSSS